MKHNRSYLLIGGMTAISAGQMAIRSGAQTAVILEPEPDGFSYNGPPVATNRKKFGGITTAAPAQARQDLKAVLEWAKRPLPRRDLPKITGTGKKPNKKGRRK